MKFKYLLKISFCLVLLISCDNKKEQTKIEKLKPILVKIGYYPTFHQSAETILNLKDNYLIFYSPTPYIEEPPAPSEKENNEHKEYLNERPQLIPFKINLTYLDVNKIQSVIYSFKQKDFSDKNIYPAHDGMSTNTIILFSDGHLIQINPMNSPNQKQRQLYTTILDILMSKNKNKNDSIILGKIKSYH